MTLHETSITIQWGHAQSEARTADTDTVVRDLVNDCVRAFSLPKKDRAGTMTIYGLYRGEGNFKEQLDPRRTLRELRVQRGDRLYLAPENAHWWLGPAAPALAGMAEEQRHPLSQPASTPGPAPSAGTTCTVELAPSCWWAVPESGLVINRAFLLAHLPRRVVALERARTLVGAPSRLEYVGRSPLGHCTLARGQGWQLVALQPVYIGGVIHSGGETVVIEQTMTVLLGRAGWPLTMRVGPPLATAPQR